MWRHHENWLTMIISFKNFISWDEKHDDRKSESLKQCAKRRKIQAVINNKEKMTRHNEKGWKNEVILNIRKNSGLHMVVTFKMFRLGKMTKYALIKLLRPFTQWNGERTVFLQPWFVSAMHVVLYTFCFLYEQRVIKKTGAIFGWILNNACISWIRDVIKMTRGVISPSPPWHTVFLSITYSAANSQTKCRTARI